MERKKVKKKKQSIGDVEQREVVKKKQRKR